MVLVKYQSQSEVFKVMMLYICTWKNCYILKILNSKTVKFWTFKFLNRYILKIQIFEPLYYFEIFEKFVKFWF